VADTWLLVASRAPGPTTRSLWDDATALAAVGADVTVVATDDAVVDVLDATDPAGAARAAGVRVRVDATAARRRGVADLPAVAPLLVEDDEVARLLLEPTGRVVWR